MENAGLQPYVKSVLQIKNHVVDLVQSLKNGNLKVTTHMNFERRVKLSRPIGL
jgi:hypothetical protein